MPLYASNVSNTAQFNAANQKNQLGLCLVAAGIDIATGIAVLSDDNPRNDDLRTDILPAAIAEGENNRFEAIDLNQLRDHMEIDDTAKNNARKRFCTSWESAYTHRSRCFLYSTQCSG